MFLRSSFPPQRSGVNRIEVAVVANLLLLTTLLMLPACYRAQDSSARRQSTNNLKQIGLAVQSFHDVNGRIPFNGIAAGTESAPAGSPSLYFGSAVPSVSTSGSWAFQLLPYVEQQALYSNPNVPQAKQAGVPTYMCPGRGRQLLEDGNGAWTDYFVNNYLNDPANADKPDNPDQKRTLLEITDGSSNTIFAGHGNIATGDYAKTKDVAGSSNIFAGGTFGTARAGNPGQKAPGGVVLARDSAAPPGNENWGGPFPQGALMCFCDGHVSLVSYSYRNFSALLTPTGAEDVPSPD